jgi:hypothetical protein
LILALVIVCFLELVAGQRPLLDPVARDRVLLDLLAVDLARRPDRASGKGQEQRQGGDDVRIGEPRSDAHR